MLASLQWLRALVPQLPDDAREVAARFTGGGLEVEAMHAYGEGAASCVVARVVGVRPHPSKSGLKLVMVERGGGQQEVVCGAPNVPDVGRLVVLAPLGTHLPAKKMTIERRAIGGVESEGMLCSEQELGLSDESDGIIVLPKDLAAPGTSLPKAEPGVRDTIFELGLTPNRPDGLGHIGLARELAALFGVPFALPVIDAAPRTFADSIESLVSVRIEDAERCPQYAAHAVIDVTVGPSPLWMRYRLAALGVRSISNAVDVTNLVMLEYGHPLHAFDFDKVRGKQIVVRRAKDGEKLRTLDGVDRVLVADDLVICDGEGPVALAGVMGGGDSEISATTKRVLLECAYFDPRGVRRTSRRHALHSESSHRFERGVDHGDSLRCVTRAAELTARLGGGAAATAAKMFEGRALPKRTASLRNVRLGQLLGVSVARDEATAILARLGLVMRGTKDGADEFDIPTHRPDLSREVDLIEEVARVRGLDKIPTVLPAIRPTIEGPTQESLWRRAREAAVEIGLSEALTYAFVSPRELEALGAPTAKIILKNPINEQQSVMRTSMLPGLLEAVGRARRHGERDVRLFAVGAVFLGGGGERELPEERMSFAAVLAGERTSYLAKPEAVDVWDAKGLALAMIERLVRRDARVTAFASEARPPHLHPRGAAVVTVEANGGDVVVGRLGLLHPNVGEALDVGGDVVVVEIDVAAVDALGRQAKKYTAIPRFPASTRDVALVVHDDVAAGDVERAVRDAAGALGAEVRLFDRFVGGAVPANHASLAFHVVYRAPDRTLTDAEVDAQHAKVIAEVGKRFGATLRA